MGLPELDRVLREYCDVRDELDELPDTASLEVREATLAGIVAAADEVLAAMMPALDRAKRRTKLAGVR